MFGNKVFLTYKRKRQSLNSSFIHGKCSQNSVCEDAHNCSLSAQVKHDKLTVEKSSEKHEEKPTDTSDGKRPCFEQPDCSSLLPLQNTGDPNTGETGNYNATEMMATTHESFSTTHPCEDNIKRDVSELPRVEKASQNNCDTQRNSYASESSVDEPTDSHSKDNFRNPSGHMVLQTNLTSPLITFNRCYKRKKGLDGTDRQSNLSHEKENISVLTKWSMLVANDNRCSSDESSSEECPVDNVPDLNQSVELSESGKALNETQDETSWRSCSMVF
ncbi:hypothetical protein E2542_SST30706 [Spatholobus suberectus]|nr:hypothetical protein E2542_SST30706 [Spatholobus suberectus]